MVLSALILRGGRRSSRRPSARICTGRNGGRPSIIASWSLVVRSSVAVRCAQSTAIPSSEAPCGPSRISCRASLASGTMSKQSSRIRARTRERTCGTRNEIGEAAGLLPAAGGARPVRAGWVCSVPAPAAQRGRRLRRPKAVLGLCKAVRTRRTREALLGALRRLVGGGLVCNGRVGAGCVAVRVIGSRRGRAVVVLSRCEALEVLNLPPEVENAHYKFWTDLESAARVHNQGGRSATLVCELGKVAVGRW